MDIKKEQKMPLLKKLNLSVFEKIACETVIVPKWFDWYEKFVAYKNYKGQLIRIAVILVLWIIAFVIYQKNGVNVTVSVILWATCPPFFIAFIVGLIRQMIIKGWIKTIRKEYNYKTMSDFTFLQIQGLYRANKKKFNCRPYGRDYDYPIVKSTKM